MNSFERIRVALQRGQPDRVPVIEFAIDPTVAEAAVPGCVDVADAADRLGIDSVGCGAIYDKVDELDDGKWVDEWGVTYGPSAEMLDHPVGCAIETMADLRRYNPPDPSAPGRLGALDEMVERYKGRRAITFHHRAAFMWSAYLNGLDSLLANFLLEPGFVHALLDMVLEVNIEIARRAARAGADIIVLGDDYAHNRGPMMSPESFAEFILPRLRRIVEVIHEEGALVIKHSDGNLYPVLDAIASSGADALNPIEPVAGMDLATTKALVGGRMAVIGNVDCGWLLCHGSPEQVRAAVRQCFEDAAPGGGYLLSSSNSIHSGVKPENFVAMVQAGLEFGQYGEGVLPR